MILEFKAEGKFIDNPFLPPYLTSEETDTQACPTP